jgi:hypothetical protein
MKEEELINKLSNVKPPEIELKSHRAWLKTALINSGYSKKKQEGTFLETVKEHTKGIFDGISERGIMGRPAWRIGLTGALALLILFATFMSIPQTSAVLKSAMFPGGSRSISGTQLNVDDQRASDILMNDARIKALLAQGAIIDKILPIEVGIERINPATGVSETITETWAQAWLVKDSQDWGVTIDMVRGQIVSINP